MTLRFLRLIPSLFLAATFVMSLTVPHSGQAQSSEAPATLVIAHQGGDGLRPGNTMVAFENAVALGVDMLEMDIHSTKDGVLVVIHDDTIDRTTDGSGRVQDYTFEELQQFDAGYDWPTLEEEAERTDRPYRGQGITIPALEEVLAAFPESLMTIEIKQQEPSIVEPFCEMLRAYEMTAAVIVASFHPETMLEFREACPEVMTSGFEDEVRAFFNANLTNRLDGFEPTVFVFQVPEYFGRLQVITPKFVTNAQALGISVQVWTPNSEEDIQRMIDAGVDGIITDYPDRALALLGRAPAAE